jgi:hypothetical protein
MKDVDGRDKPGHDEKIAKIPPLPVIPGRADGSAQSAAWQREPGIQQPALDSGFVAIGPRFCADRWRRPGMTLSCGGARSTIRTNC